MKNNYWFENTPVNVAGFALEWKTASMLTVATRKAVLFSGYFEESLNKVCLLNCYFRKCNTLNFPRPIPKLCDDIDFVVTLYKWNDA